MLLDVPAPVIKNVKCMTNFCSKISTHIYNSLEFLTRGDGDEIVGILSADHPHTVDRVGVGTGGQWGSLDRGPFLNTVVPQHDLTGVGPRPGSSSGESGQRSRTSPETGNGKCVPGSSS